MVHNQPLVTLYKSYRLTYSGPASHRQAVVYQCMGWACKFLMTVCPSLQAGRRQPATDKGIKKTLEFENLSGIDFSPPYRTRTYARYTKAEVSTKLSHHRDHVGI